MLRTEASFFLMAERTLSSGFFSNLNCVFVFIKWNDDSAEECLLTTYRTMAYILTFDCIAFVFL